MYIKSVSESVKDVFLNKGWNHWIRLDLSEKKVVKSSIKVSPVLLKTLLEKVHK